MLSHLHLSQTYYISDPHGNTTKYNTYIDFPQQLTSGIRTMISCLLEDSLKFYITLALILMSILAKFCNFGFGIINKVNQHPPRSPIRLVLKSINGDSSANTDAKATTTTIKELIKTSKIKEFYQDAISFMNPLLFHAHLQTSFAGIRSFSKTDILYFGRQTMQFKDGGSAAVDYAISKDQYLSSTVEDTVKVPKNTRMLNSVELDALDNGSSDTKPMMIILHGLSGSSSESYVRCVLKKIENEFIGVVLNSRGCGLAPITTPQLFNGCWTDDIRELVDFLHLKYPNRPLYAAGFSLGGSILANYLGQEGDKCVLTHASIIATPWDLCQSLVTMTNSFISHQIYSPVMTVPLKQLLLTHYDVLSQNETFNRGFAKLDTVYRLNDFDDLFTGPLFGFNCANEYYRVGSAVNRIHNIRVPTLIINSLDDPIVGGGKCNIPIKEVELNPYLFLLTTRYGGHLSWFNQFNERWYARPLAQFLLNFNAKIDSSSPALVDEAELPKVNKMTTGKLIGDFKN